MRLTELEPRWIHENVFVFRCPCCIGTERALWLSCKDAAIERDAQRDLFRESGLEPEGRAAVVMATRPEVAWSINSHDFATMSVTPSIDASASGHWHGFITNGEAT
jgi:hypothetical protein